MTEKDDSSTSGNAVNQPWSPERVGELTDLQGRSRRRAVLFASILQEKLPGDVQTDTMLWIAEAMAKMRNGNDSVRIYAGHSEQANPKTRHMKDMSSAPEKPSHSVIERLGHAAVNECGVSIPDDKIVWAVAELYRHSPACQPQHRELPPKMLESVVRDLLEKYEKM